MATKKRRKSASSAEPSNVRQAIQELRDFFKLGREVLTADEKNPKKQTYSKEISISFAEQLGKSRDYVDKARQFASSYTEKQFEELCSLRRPDGLPLRRRHLVALLSVENKGERKRLQRKAAKEGWGYRRLGEEIVVIQGSQSSGGRRPRGPDSVEDALAQLIKMSEQWRRWYELFETQDDQDRVTLEDLPDDVAKALKSISGRMTKLTGLAQSELGVDDS